VLVQDIDISSMECQLCLQYQHTPLQHIYPRLFGINKSDEQLSPCKKSYKMKLGTETTLSIMGYDQTMLLLMVINLMACFQCHLEPWEYKRHT